MTDEPHQIFTVIKKGPIGPSLVTDNNDLENALYGNFIHIHVIKLLVI